MGYAPPLTADVTTPTGSTVATLVGTAGVESIIRANTLDQLTPPVAPVTFTGTSGAQKATGLANGSVAGDAVTYGQLTAAVTVSFLTQTVTGATVNSTTSVTINIPSTAGLVAGDHVTVAGVVGPTNVNGSWVIASLVANTSVTVTTTAASGAYSSGGTVAPAFVPTITGVYRVTCVGSGGGGGGGAANTLTTSTSTGAAGGGAGGTSQALLSLTAGTAYTIALAATAAGGNGGAAAGANTGSGGGGGSNTTFGTLLIAGGGGGGNGGALTNATTNILPGAGGVATLAPISGAFNSASTVGSGGTANIAGFNVPISGIDPSGMACGGGGGGGNAGSTSKGGSAGTAGTYAAAGAAGTNGAQGTGLGQAGTAATVVNYGAGGGGGGGGNNNLAGGNGGASGQGAVFIVGPMVAGLF